MAVAALVGVAGLLLGAILGFLLGNTVGKASTAAPKASTTQTQTSTSGSGSSAQPGPLPAGVTTMPPGHPPVSVPTTNAADTTTTK
jgi:ABC-type antimicrobial peptide transport system permease subunit